MIASLEKYFISEGIINKRLNVIYLVSFCSSRKTPQDKKLFCEGEEYFVG